MARSERSAGAEVKLEQEKNPQTELTGTRAGRGARRARAARRPARHAAGRGRAAGRPAPHFAGRLRHRRRVRRDRRAGRRRLAPRVHPSRPGPRRLVRQQRGSPGLAPLGFQLELGLLLGLRLVPGDLLEHGKTPPIRLLEHRLLRPRVRLLQHRPRGLHRLLIRGEAPLTARRRRALTRRRGHPVVDLGREHHLRHELLRSRRGGHLLRALRRHLASPLRRRAHHAGRRRPHRSGRRRSHHARRRSHHVRRRPHRVRGRRSHRPRRRPDDHAVEPRLRGR